MSYDNVYYSPEKYGLRTIGEIDFSSGSYEFDILVVFQDVETGKFYYAEDSGCSCPSPFEDHDRTTLTPFVDSSDLRSRAERLLKDRGEDCGYADADDVRALLYKVAEAAR